MYTDRNIVRRIDRATRQISHGLLHEMRHAWAPGFFMENLQELPIFGGKKPGSASWDLRYAEFFVHPGKFVRFSLWPEYRTTIEQVP